MPLTLPVLVRGINNLSDARYCAGMGAAGLIFTLDPALPGAVTPELVRELAGWVAGVELLGEFHSLPAAEINRLVAECGLGRVLLTGPAAGAAAAALAVPVLPTVVYQPGAPLPDLTGRWLSGGPFPLGRLPALLAAHPAGLLLDGGHELKPGLRDFTDLEAVFEALEAE